MNFALSCPHWNEKVTFYDTEWTNAGIQGHAQAYDNKLVHNVTVPCDPLGPVIEHVFGGKLDLPGEFLFSGRRRCRKTGSGYN